MRVVGIREIRSNTSELLGGDEPLLVTRHGKITGIYLPLRDADRFPVELRRELGQMLSTHLANQFVGCGRTEEEIQQDFAAFRRYRR